VSVGGFSAHELSRRVSVYNLVWATVGAVMVAINGLIIETYPSGVFLISLLTCAAAAVILVVYPVAPVARCHAIDSDARIQSPEPEPKLARQRIQALWLSRICVPAMYIAIYALAALLPSLTSIQTLRPAMQTLVSSVWLVVRCLAFVVLGATVFWHTRPRLLLWAAALLLVSFLVITIRPGDFVLWEQCGLTIDLSAMIAGQVMFGLACGLIYTASLYFGMVLSDGSTEHSGYHEALIGMGIALGPAAGAAAEYLAPGSSHAAIGSVAALIAASVLLASIASLRLSHRRRRRRERD
jgi:hypothetical protein